MSRKMSQRQTFKITILSHDKPLFERLYDIFGVDFEKAMTETSGAAFSYSHFNLDDGERLTAQFWLLDGSPQWSSIRNLYLKGSSGIILLHDPSIKNADAINRRLLREFVSTNRVPVPMILINVAEEDSLAKTESLAKDIERWAGYEIRAIRTDTDNIDYVLSRFMLDVRDWRARNVIFQTLKLYFSLDSINNKKRSITKIINQLRQIFTSRYYEMLSDESIFEIVLQGILIEEYQYDPEEKCVVYQKEITKHPWTKYEEKLGPNEYVKPSVEKLS